MKLKVVGILLFICSAAVAGAASLTTSPAVRTVEAKAPLQGVVTLEANTPIQLAIPLTSSNPAAASVPASVTVRAGSSRATFAIDVNAVAADTSVTIRASVLGIGHTTTFFVLAPARVTGVTVNPNPVIGGQPASATATINRPATYGGVPVTFTSGTLTVATVPTSATIPAGASSVNVPVSAKEVVTTSTAAIRATAGGSTVSTSLTVQPPPLEVLSIAVPSPIVSDAAAKSGTVTFTPAAGGSSIRFSSDHPNVQVPASATLSAGQTTHTFPVSVTGVRPGTPAASARITATLGTSSKTATITLEGPPITLAFLTVPSAMMDGTVAPGQVSMSGPPAQDLVVSLSSDSGYLRVPATLTIPAGLRDVPFDMTSSGVPVGGTVGVNVTAAYGGVSLQQRVSIRGKSPTLAGITIPPVQSGTPAIGQVSLVEPSVQAVQVFLSCSCSSLGVTMPSTLIIPAGQASANFEISANVPFSMPAQPVTAVATLDRVSKTATFMLSPPPPAVAVSTLEISPALLLGGAPATGTITLNRADTSSPATVFLNTDKAHLVTIPPSVNVPAGQTAISFPISTTRTSQREVLTMTAQLGGKSVIAPMTLRPYHFVRMAFTPSTVPVSARSATLQIEISDPAPEEGLEVGVFCQTTDARTPCPSMLPLQRRVPAGQRIIDISLDLPATLPENTAQVTWHFTVTSRDTPNSLNGTLTIVP